MKFQPKMSMMAVARNSKQNNAIVTIGQMHELAYEDIVLSIDYKTKVGKVAFQLVKNCKRKLEFPEGNEFGMEWA